MPERIQLSRAKGWRMPPDTVKVDRTTKWGNPFVPGKPAPVGPTKGAIVQDKRHAFVLYRSMAPLNPALIAAARAELAGKNLACWCGRDDPYEDACHAAVLLQLANGADGVALPDQALRDTAAEINRTAAAFIAGGVTPPVEVQQRENARWSFQQALYAWREARSITGAEFRAVMELYDRAARGVKGPDHG